ncbi:MAG: response regulator [candidate division Zixibacteria bacterium]|nr:response regulator [candidate division Zixibacteria bacterium]
MARQILIVDDNPNMASLLSDMLDVFDYQTVRADDGMKALEAMDKQNFSLVITDMRMPNMSGMELLEKIKERNPSLPVVLISGYSIKDFESETNKPDGFLAKPFMMSDIEQLLNSLL